MVAKFRLMRLHCHIQRREVAEAANISPQRINQFETRYYGSRPKNPERLIKALEMIITQRKKELEKIEYICKHERETLLDNVPHEKIKQRELTYTKKTPLLVAFSLY